MRSTSGTGIVSAAPNISPAETCFGIWSTVLAEYTFCVPSACSSDAAVEQRREVVRVGLPR